MKFENNNGEVIKRITKRSLKTNKIRNLFAICAIVLTTFMISSVFSIGISFAKNFSVMSRRMNESTATTFLSMPTESQIKEIEKLDIAENIGTKISIGKARNETLQENSVRVDLEYFDTEAWENQILPCIGEIEGKYPVEENEIMASRKALELLGVKDAKLNDSIEIKYNINGELESSKFVLAGLYTDYRVAKDKGYIKMSEKFINSNGLKAETDGKLYITLKNNAKDTARDLLNENIKLNANQQFKYTSDTAEEASNTMIIVTIVACIIALFIVLSGYLLIYNVMYIAVIKDINFYGLLKTIGTSPSQIQKIVKGQVLRLSVIGIPVGVLLGGLASFILVPMAMNMNESNIHMAQMPSDVSFSPLIFIATILFSLLAVNISCRKPAKVASSISPTEALRYSGVKTSKKKKNRKSTKGGKIYKMAWYNVFRDKKRAFIVFLSLFMGLITFLSVDTVVTSINIENYVEQSVPNDFLIQNIDIGSEEGEKKLSKDIVDDIKGKQGIQSISETKSAFMEVEMNEKLLLPSIESGYERFSENPKEELKKLLDDIKKDPSILSSYIIGIDEVQIERFNEGATERIDVEAFKVGKLALIDDYYYPMDNNDIKGEKLTVKSSNGNSKIFDAKIVRDENYILPSEVAGVERLTGMPTMYISKSVLEELNENTITYILRINVEKEQEAIIKTDLNELASSRGLWIETRSDMVESFKSTKMIMNILGGGVGVILVLIGILNFINVMITGINVRLKELAVMESIGMTKKQIKKMLTFEGFYYATITSVLICTVGVGIIYGMAELTDQIIEFAKFEFPALQILSIIIMIFAICLITPSVVFKMVSKKSVTERIREIES